MLAKIDLRRYQDKIASFALDLFSHYWNSPYIFRSDAEWLHLLRYSRQNDHNYCINFGIIYEFFTDYGVGMKFPWKRLQRSQTSSRKADFFHYLLGQVHSDFPDPWQLAQDWNDKDVTSKHQYSAASKLLFFCRPDAKLAIYDSNAQRAINNRSQSIIKSVRSGEDFSLYFDIHIKLARIYQRMLTSRCNRMSSIHDSDLRFMCRRIADKHLFIEGRIIKEFNSKKVENKNNDDLLPEICRKETKWVELKDQHNAHIGDRSSLVSNSDLR